MNKNKKASYGMKKMRGGDYMEPNKELQFGSLKKDPDKETYYGGPNTKAGRIAKRADNKAGRIAARKAGKGAKQMMKDAGESNKYARTVGRKVKKTTKATSTHSRRNSTIGEKADKAKQIGKRFVKKQDNIKAKEAGKDKVQAARKMLKGGVKPVRKKAVAGAVVQGAAAGLQGIGKLTDAIAGKETKFGKIAGAVGQTAGAVGGMMGGIPGDPMGKAMSAVPSPSGAQSTAPAPGERPGMATPLAPGQATAQATTPPTDPAAAKVEQQANTPMKRGGKKKKGRRKYQGGGELTPMKKKQVTGVNANMASTRGSGIGGAKPVISKVTGTTSSNKGGDSGSSDDYKMRKNIQGTKTIGGKRVMTHRKDVVDGAKGKNLTNRQKKRRGPAPMRDGGAKPDFPDLDNDGNKTEPMSKALKDRRSSARKGKMKGEKKKPGRNVG